MKTKTPKKNRGDHVVMAVGGFKCTHCGELYIPQLRCSLGMLEAMGKQFISEHAECAAPGSSFCTFCQATDHVWHEHVGATCKTARDWPMCGDTGKSSVAIFQHFIHGKARPVMGEVPIPFDPGDFGRCHRLLSASWAAGWRERMSEMSAYPTWTKLAEHWGELTALYVEEFPAGKSPKLLARMDELRETT